MTYSVRLKPFAEKSLRTLPKEAQKRIGRVLSTLGENSFPPSSKKLQSPQALYRIRVGDYRIIYEVINEDLIVLVLAIGHRREIYR